MLVNLRPDMQFFHVSEKRYDADRQRADQCLEVPCENSNFSGGAASLVHIVPIVFPPIHSQT